MIEIIKKLVDKNIFKEDTLIEAEVTKSFMGSPVKKVVVLKVEQVYDTYCLADEQNALEYNPPMRKIMFKNITIVDGMEPIELAAVYGLAPKTTRFNTRQEQ